MYEEKSGVLSLPRIDLKDPAQVIAWANELAISEDRLLEIVNRVGPMTAAIRYYAVSKGSKTKDVR